LAAAWWPVALSDEVRTAPIAARAGDREVAVFRDRQGFVHALDDRCPHRRLPLSLGRVTDDGFLQCGYHGWCWDGDDGRCVKIPGYRPEERVPSKFVVGAFPVAERSGHVLVWIGEDAEGGVPPPPQLAPPRRTGAAVFGRRVARRLARAGFRSVRS
jgi:phenylpropionate dioxygenase-like ring-hydroxylating dioxygenase large terminal subunit